MKEVFQPSPEEDKEPGMRRVGHSIPSRTEHVQRPWDEEELLEPEELETRMKSKGKHTRRLQCGWEPFLVLLSVQREPIED